MKAVLELDDPAALLTVRRQVVKAHGMAEVARRADVGESPIPRPERKRKPDYFHAAQDIACRGAAS